MDTQTVNQIEIIPLLGYELKRAGAGYSVGACPFCGGTDRFTVKHTRDGDRWHCRQCGDGKYHTVIDYIMRRDNVPFKTALQTLGGAGPTRTPVMLPKPQPKPITLPDATWQANAWHVVDIASDALMTAAGKSAREYLITRGLTVSTWEAWHIGAASVWDPKVKRVRPAITLPWTNGDEIHAVKYRFIDADPDGLRYTALSGSVPVLFGASYVLESHKTLLLVEGEINALAIWQCLLHGVSVLSFGSEGSGRADILRNVARHYKHVVIWCDEAERTKHYQSVLGRPCLKIQSLKIDGDKLDADRLLVLDKLPEFLSHVLGTYPTE